MRFALTAPGTIVVGVADLAIASAARERCLTTFGLGSCIGVAAHDPATGIGGLLHFMLPKPPAPEDHPNANPCLYASTGIERLLRCLVDAGASRDRLVLCAAGAADTLRGSCGPAVGERNRRALAEVLAHHGVSLAGADFGGQSARTLSLELQTGEVTVASRGSETMLGSASSDTTLSQ